MSVLVVYDSRHGNTEAVARAIAANLEQRRPGSVRLVRAEEVGGPLAERPELLLVGGPTQRHRITAALRAALVALAGGERRLERIRAAAFDTRYRMSSLLSGSAANDAAKLLRSAGCEVIGRPESFFMERDHPGEGKRRHEIERLEPGELDRAARWAQSLVP